ncbi:hypothetical protein MSUIS_01170 [Mycoplasma suis KI3806]|uniref:Uncharacterized protein n=1 Tax=Mycoplasma suis (strain KI_3806) TaxID=708248 RepID=F0V2Y8_MYCS3|nr:hypothetical protein [Mycoplasma suis]CBZ40210.1 hypothetical protein MSUIS_01170 [Mycoplasma suis KI3806]
MFSSVNLAKIALSIFSLGGIVGTTSYLLVKRSSSKSILESKKISESWESGAPEHKQTNRPKVISSSRVIAEHIDNWGTNDYPSCKRWIEGKENERNNNLNPEECQKLIQNIWNNSEQEKPDMFLKIDSSGDKPEEFLRTIYVEKPNNLLVPREETNNWIFKNMDCNVKKDKIDNEKIIVSCKYRDSR